MSKMYSTANLTDKELKEQGNRLFSLHKYEDAANCYSKAIVSKYKNFFSLDYYFLYFYKIFLRLKIQHKRHTLQIALCVI